MNRVRRMRATIDDRKFTAKKDEGTGKMFGWKLKSAGAKMDPKTLAGFWFLSTKRNKLHVCLC